MSLLCRWRRVGLEDGRRLARGGWSAEEQRRENQSLLWPELWRHRVLVVKMIQEEEEEESGSMKKKRSAIRARVDPFTTRQYFCAAPAVTPTAKPLFLLSLGSAAGFRGGCRWCLAPFGGPAANHDAHNCGRLTDQWLHRLHVTPPTAAGLLQWPSWREHRRV